MKSDTHYNNFLTERFGNHFWNQVIYHSIQNDDFLKKVVNRIPIEVFGSKEKKYIAKMIFDFYLEYKTAPKDNFYDLFKEAEKSLAPELYNKCINLISILKELSGTNWEYILSRIDDAIKHYRLEEASVEFATLIKNKKYDEARTVILEAMRPTEEGESSYFDFFTDKSYISDRLSEQKYKMKTLIKGLDDLIGGLNPSWLLTILGVKKSGKCLKGDSIITFANGEQETIEYVVKNKIFGDVISYNEKTKKFEKATIINHQYNGKKECFKIMTKTGRIIEATDNHPFLTPSGWRKLSELCVGSYIAAPKQPPQTIDFCNSEIFYDEIVSITSTGVHNVYDISLNKNYNFIANNLIAHNSFLMLELAVAAVLQGKNVLFVSLEMNKKVIEERLDQMIGFMSSKVVDGPVDIFEFKHNKWKKEKVTVDNIFNIDAVEKNRNKIKRIGGGGLKIMAFNRGRVNYLDIEAILDELEQKDGFITDVLIVDYLGIMKRTEPTQDDKSAISANCLGIKELLGKRNLIGITAMQGNRQAMKAKIFHSDMIAKDIDVTQHSDIVVSISQTPKEETEGKYRLYIADNRHGPQHISIGMIRDLTIGQVALGEYDLTSEEFIEEEENSEDYY